MRICVFGAGSIGGHVAARLAAAGHEVSVVARGAHLDAIRVRGLELRFNGPQPAIRARVAASDRPADLGPQDAVFITTKANALSASAGSLAPLLGPVTPVAFVQNGIPWWYARGLRAGRPPPPDLSALDPGGALERAIGFERTIGGVVLSSNEVVEPGIVRNQTPTRNVLTLGEIDDRPSERVAALRLALRDAGMSSPDTADIRLVAWNKLLRNLSRSTLCALSGESIHDLFHADAAMQELARRIATEAVAVAAAHGFDVDIDVPGMFGPKDIVQPHKPSILQDYERGRPMEVEALIKAPQQFARAAGVDTPSLDAVVALIVHRARTKGLY